jgi:hypothetical protein
LVPGNESEKIVWPDVKTAGAVVALLVLATVTVHVQEDVLNGTLPLMLSARVAVRSGQSVVNCVAGVALFTVALALLFAHVEPLVNVATAVPVVWIVVSAIEIEPLFPLNAIGKSRSALRSLVPIGVIARVFEHGGG